MDEIVRPEPSLIKDVLPKEVFQELLTECLAMKKKNNQEELGRFLLGNKEFPLLQQCFDLSLPKAREVFNSETLLPTYALFCSYQGRKASLFKHKDNNACTYTLDMGVYHGINWGLFVEGKEYFTEPNEAVAFYGNDQEHWRGPFPDPEKNYVGVVFFHYAEPDHWYFTKGPTYMNVLNNTWTERRWRESQG